jgi:predicted PurR-regulated permease PerM
MILSVPFAVPLAVLMAFLDLIPLVGATIGGVGIGIVAAISDFPTALIVWAIFFVVYQQIENNLLQPIIYRRTVQLHPLVVLIAVLIGGSQLGVLGALIAIPVAAGLQILLKDWWRGRKGTIVTPSEKPPPPTSEIATESP